MTEWDATRWAAATLNPAQVPPTTRAPGLVGSLDELRATMATLKAEGLEPRPQEFTIAHVEGWPIGSTLRVEGQPMRVGSFIEAMTPGDVWRFRVLIPEHVVRELRARAG